MSMQTTPGAERVHIAFFGAMNAGKSSLINALTKQALSVVSDTPGTTTDPVKKAMELLPLGPVVLIDTPGYDDRSALGALRVEKTNEILRSCHLAILVAEAGKAFGDTEDALLAAFKEHDLPYLIVRTKADLLAAIPNDDDREIYVSAASGYQIDLLKERIAKAAKKEDSEQMIIADFIPDGSLIVLVTPIDESAPKGRLILPQMLVLREALDHHMHVQLCQDTELEDTLSLLKTAPALVITDSQVFDAVAKTVPAEVPLTSFSILFARYKGELTQLLEGLDALDTIKDGDHILISEGCTHHRQCNDIGTTKIPAWIENYIHAKPRYSFTSGNEFPTDLADIKLIVHCGACMLPAPDMKGRLAIAHAQNTPMVNYGMLIAKMGGILPRALAPIPLSQ